MAKSCGTCEFWDFLSSYPHKTEGECHRHAPKASTDGHMLGSCLSQIAIALFDHVNHITDREEVDGQIEQFERDTTRHNYGRIAEWPETSVDNWCGEWQAKEEPV